MPDVIWALTRPLVTARLSSKVPTTFDLAPDAAIRAAVAKDLEILGVPHLRFAGTITPAGRRDFVLEGDLVARVTQACVVTLAPVTTDLSDHVLRRFVHDHAVPDADEVEIPQDDSVEALGDTIDPGAVAVEALALLLPEYPRAAGAAFMPATVADNDVIADRPKPFAGLAGLAAEMAAKLPDPDENGSG